MIHSPLDENLNPNTCFFLSTSLTDIAVGSLYSSHIIVLRSRRILALTHRLTSTYNKIAQGTPKLEIKYCFSYTPLAADTMDIVISAESDDRAVIIEPNRPRNVTISSSRTCENFSLVLKVGTIGYKTVLHYAIHWPI